MKTLVLVLMIVFASSCGTDTLEELDFFKEYLPVCVGWCDVAQQLGDQCATTPFSVDECVSNAWWAGCSNRVCEIMTNKLAEKLENNDCTDVIGMPSFFPTCRDI